MIDVCFCSQLAGRGGDGAGEIPPGGRGRKKFAEEENVPPYFIFNDKTLVEIANQKPSTRSGLLSISGIGELKAKKFGDDILRIIDGA